MSCLRAFGLNGATRMSHRDVIHDRDSIYSGGVNRTLAAMSVTVLRTPVQAPQANAFCERLVGTIRRVDCGSRGQLERSFGDTQFP